MEFLHAGNDPKSPIDSMRINWLYRPRDIGRKVNDTRQVFVTMHSDPCPLTSLRGKAQVLHRAHVDDLDKYRKGKDCFFYTQMFDRYFRRYYDVIPTKQVINVPQRVKRVLDERWAFVIVELGRGKELTSAIKTCKRCVGYCARYVMTQGWDRELICWQQQLGRLRRVQEYLPHELRSTSAAQKASPRFWLVVRSLQSQARAQTRGSQYSVGRRKGPRQRRRGGV